MKIKWQRNAGDQIKAAENHYPRFRAWEPGNPAENCWHLMIKRSAADQEPITVRNLPSPETVEEFVEGFLKGLANNSDKDLPITIHFSTGEIHTPCKKKVFPHPSGRLRICESMGPRTAKRRFFFSPQMA